MGSAGLEKIAVVPLAVVGLPNVDGILPVWSYKAYYLLD